MDRWMDGGIHGFTIYLYVDPILSVYLQYNKSTN